MHREDIMLRHQVTKMTIERVMRQSTRDRNAYITQVLTRARSEDPLLWTLITTLSHCASVEMRELSSPHSDVVKRIVEEVGALLIATVALAEQEGVRTDPIKNALMSDPDIIIPASLNGSAHQEMEALIKRHRYNK
jgi:hypothetical protein